MGFASQRTEMLVGRLKIEPAASLGTTVMHGIPDRAATVGDTQHIASLTHATLGNTP